MLTLPDDRSLPALYESCWCDALWCSRMYRCDLDTHQDRHLLRIPQPLVSPYATHWSRHRADTILAKHHATNISTNRRCNQRNHGDGYLTPHHPIIAFNCREVTVKTVSEGRDPSNKKKVFYHVDDAVITIWPHAWYNCIFGEWVTLKKIFSWHLAGVQYSHSAPLGKCSNSLIAVFRRNGQLWGPNRRTKSQTVSLRHSDPWLRLGKGRSLRAAVNSISHIQFEIM